MIELVNPIFIRVKVPEERFPRFHTIASIVNPMAYQVRKRSRSLRNWDGRDVLYMQEPDAQPGVYLTYRGLLSTLTSNGFGEVVGGLPPLDVKYQECLRGTTLDAIQQSACEALMAEQVAMSEMKTASGKSEIITNLAACWLVSEEVKRRRAAKKPWCVLVIEPSLVLLKQQTAVMARYLPSLRIACVGGGKEDEPSVITCSNIATLVNRPNLCLGAGLVLIDEAHHAVTDSYLNEVFPKLDPEAVVWAVSGKVSFTQKNRHQEERIRAVFGMPVFMGDNKARKVPVVVQPWSFKCPALPELKHGTLEDPAPVPCVFRMTPEGPLQTGLWIGPNSIGKWPSKFVWPTPGSEPRTGIWLSHDGKTMTKKVDPPSELTTRFDPDDLGITVCQFRNELARNIAVSCAEKKELFLITCRRAMHLDNVMRLLIPTGMKLAVMSGKVSGDEQQKVCELANRGEVDGIVAIYNCASEGVNLPPLRHLIKLDGIKSEQILEQQVGRLQRSSGEKTHGTLHLPVDYHHPTLRKRYNEFASYYRSAGLDVLKTADG
jgi:hypothetical protein